MGKGYPGDMVATGTKYKIWRAGQVMDFGKGSPIRIKKST